MLVTVTASPSLAASARREAEEPMALALNCCGM
jgi:hypothetical protein